MRLSRRSYLQAAAGGDAGGRCSARCRTRPAGAQGAGTAAGPPSGAFRIWVSAYFPVSGDPMWTEIFDWFRASHPNLRVEIGEGAVRGERRGAG